MWGASLKVRHLFLQDQKKKKKKAEGAQTSFRTWVFLPSKGCLKVFPVLLTEQKPHHVFCHRLCSPLETLVVREGKSLLMVPVGVEGVGGLATGWWEREGRHH